MPAPLMALAAPIAKKIVVGAAKKKAMGSLSSLASGNSSEASTPGAGGPVVDPNQGDGSAVTGSKGLSNVLDSTVGRIYGIPSLVEHGGVINGKLLDGVVTNKKGLIDSLSSGDTAGIKRNGEMLSQSADQFADAESVSMEAQAFNHPVPSPGAEPR